MTEHKSLAAALVAFQAESPTLARDGLNPHFKSRFTPLDTIVETIRPILAKHGLAWSALPSSENGEPALRYRLTHVSGEALEGVMPLMMAKQDPQGQGSAITYARRYSISAVLNLVSDEDDDGNAAQKGAQKRQPPVKSSNGHEKLSADAVVELSALTEGLTVGQVKLVFTSCGIPMPTGRPRFEDVPKEKAAILAQALAGVDRPA